MIRGGAAVLAVKDVGHAVRFYVETLGMKLVQEAADETPVDGRRGSAEGGTRYGSATIDAGEGFRIELRANATGAQAPSTAPAMMLYAKVPIEEAIAIYENRGVTFTTVKSAAAVVASFCDPDGNLLALQGT